MLGIITSQRGEKRFEGSKIKVTHYVQGKLRETTNEYLRRKLEGQEIIGWYIQSMERKKNVNHEHYLQSHPKEMKVR